MHVYVKVKTVRNELIVAICDEELLGRKLEDKEREFIFEVEETFYKGEKMAIEDSIIHLKKASIVNLIGNKIVEKAIEKGFVSQGSIIKIAGISHAQLVRM